MAKRIIVQVDYQGGVRVDLSGFQGGQCLLEEQKLRQALADCGLDVRVTGQRRKPPESLCAIQSPTSVQV